MCNGCGEMKPKRELMRIVKQPDGTVVADATGKRAGRGAYICKQSGCLQKARKTHRLEKNLSCRISDEVYDALDAAVKQEEGAPDARCGTE